MSSASQAAHIITSKIFVAEGAEEDDDNYNRGVNVYIGLRLSVSWMSEIKRVDSTS